MKLCIVMYYRHYCIYCIIYNLSLLKHNKYEWWSIWTLKVICILWFDSVHHNYQVTNQERFFYMFVSFILCNHQANYIHGLVMFDMIPIIINKWTTFSLRQKQHLLLCNVLTNAQWTIESFSHADIYFHFNKR